MEVVLHKREVPPIRQLEIELIALRPWFVATNTMQKQNNIVVDIQIRQTRQWFVIYKSEQVITRCAVYSPLRCTVVCILLL